MDTVHVALFPFPEQGHITPMLQLALHLASRGAYVTFIHTELGQQNLSTCPEQPCQTTNFRYARISDGISAHQGTLTLDVLVSNFSGRGDASSSAMPVLLRSLESQSPALEKLLTDLNGAQNWPPFSWFISDAFLPWTEAVAYKLQLPWMVFWTTSATRLYMTMEAFDHKEMDVEQLKHAANIPGLPAKSSNVFELLRLQNPQRLGLLMARAEALKKADTVLLNTCDALEGEAIKELASKLPIRSLGPLCHGAQLKSSKVDDECVSWLDRQAPHSVLYVSFGSKVVLGGKALEQLALGIESSYMPFLWALRTGGDGLPEGFLERTKARSKVMLWAPQKQVLEHRAVGAFFTHCGWNSAIEAVVEGVPMICWPTFADQPTNKLLIEHKWRIGRGTEGLEVIAADIAHVIEDVMGNGDFRRQASLLALSAKAASEQGGTSYQNFSFLLSRSRAP